MVNNSRFAVAVHVLAGLAIVKMQKKDECIPSERIAWSVNTNPVVVRRILGRLQEAGLVASETGASGGSRLAGDPQKITLQDVYRAVEVPKQNLTKNHSPNQNCPVGARILPALEGVMNNVEDAVRRELQDTTIAEIAKDIMQYVN